MFNNGAMTMMKKVLTTVALIGSLAAGIAAAYAGAFTQYPQVGNTQNTQNPPGPAYSTTCTSFGNPTSAVPCNQFQPYGPQTLTGTETIPADTNYVNPQGAQVQPVTVTIPLTSLGAGGFTVTAVPVTATIPNGVVNQIYTGTTASAFTVTLPANPTPLQTFTLTCQVATTGNMTIAANTNQTLSPTWTAGVCPLMTSYEWQYQTSNATWYRIR